MKVFPHGIHFVMGVQDAFGDFLKFGVDIVPGLVPRVATKTLCVPAVDPKVIG